MYLMCSYWQAMKKQRKWRKIAWRFFFFLLLLIIIITTDKNLVVACCWLALLGTNVFWKEENTLTSIKKLAYIMSVHQGRKEEGAWLAPSSAYFYCKSRIEPFFNSLHTYHQAAVAVTVVTLGIAPWWNDWMQAKIEQRLNYVSISGQLLSSSLSLGSSKLGFCNPSSNIM